ncbi:hypothetical protein Trydic_g7681 [Trypoxylus dichotomus]
METDAPRPSTSTAKPFYAAAVKKSAAKTVARKPKTSGQPKTPVATIGPKSTPKKPETQKPGKPVNRQSPRTPPETSPGRRPTGRNPTSRARWPC